MHSTDSTIDRLVAKAGRLYSLPSVAMEVLALTGDPKVDAQALKQCIENDPALTTKLLRVVNSSLFGLSRRVSDLNQALAMLGTKPLKLLVLGFSLPPELFNGINADVLGWYWRHTLTRAVAAREISEAFWNRSGDEAFIAGLLQDLGILLLIQELGDPYMQFLRKVLDLGGDLSTAEAESIGFAHTALTARLLRHWGLPDHLIGTVGPQHDAANDASTLLTDTLSMAELAARFLADERTEMLGELLQVGQRRHGLTQGQVEAVVCRLQEKVAQLADVLSLKLPDGLDYQDLLRQAHAQLAGVADDAAVDLLSGPESEETLIEESQALLDEFRSLSMAINGPHIVPAEGRVSQQAASGASGASEEPSQNRPTAPTDRQLSRHFDSTSVSTGGELERKLAKTVATCRQHRCPLSLLLIELEEEGEPFYCGTSAFCESLDHVEDLCRSIEHPHAECDPYKGAGFSLILPDCDRPRAVQLGNQLIKKVRDQVQAKSLTCPSANVCVGVAAVSLPPKNFPPSDLLTRAERCLYGSRASGGGVVKSIEI